MAQLVDRRRAAELVGEVVARLGHLELELLRPARDVERPRAIAEVALDLAEDGGCRVRGEAHVARQVEAVDGLHDPDARDLDEVVERLAPPHVATGERAGERQHLLGQLVARPGVAVLVVAAQQHAFTRGTCLAGPGPGRTRVADDVRCPHDARRLATLQWRHC